MGGRCDGGCFVENFFERNLQSECLDCVHRVETDYDGYRVECQALQGLEPATICPALQEHIRYHGIKLYGVNR